MTRLRYTALLLAMLAPVTFAETIVCSYGEPNAKGPAIVELKVTNLIARVRHGGKFDFADDYQVLANTPYGLVISHTYAAPEAEGMSPTIGAYTFLIDRKSGEMRTQGFFVNEPDRPSVRGTCIFQK